MCNQIQLPDKSLAALERFLGELRSIYLAWYVKEVKNHHILWVVSQIVAYGSSIMATIMAAIVQSQYEPIWLGLSATVSVLAVVLPSLSALAVTFISRYHKLEKLRDDGEIAVREMLQYADYRLANLKNPEKELPDFHHNLINKLKQIEQKQNSDFFSFTTHK